VRRIVVSRSLVFLLVAVVGVVFAVAVASGSTLSASRPSSATFISWAMQSSAGKAWGLGSLFPRKPGSIKCVIHGGGPAPGIRVPGTCSTTVLRGDKLGATVRFVERWNAHDFHGPGAGKRTHLSHTYDLWVSQRTVGGSHLVQSKSYGDVPPQSVR
jgi:hypothetical protein